VISLKRFLDDETKQALERIIQLLFRGMSLHAVKGAPQDYDQFREIIQQISDSVDESLSVSEMQIQAGLALKAAEDYSRCTTQHLLLQSSELQAMVKMLTATIGAISATGDENVRRLYDIEQQVTLATQIEDIRLIKLKLFDCLDEIRQEAERQQTQTRHDVDQLNRGIQSSGAARSEPSDTDPVTGLPPRPAAESVLDEACLSEVPAFAAVMVIDRLPTFNVRFGHAVGDQVLRLFTRFLKGQLSAEDRLFRWSGPTLVALLNRPGTIEQVCSEIGRIMKRTLEQKVRTETCTISLPIAARWAVFPMMASPRLLSHKIDSFATSRMAHD
jgi:diguanylate cyclase (GGDEF)-like protein